MFFNDVAGNASAKKSLIAQVRCNRISHAQLFYGMEGTGTLPMALAFATFLFCNNRQDEDSCGICSSCLKMKNLAHPDFHIFFPVNSTKRVSRPVSNDFIAEWRKLITANPYLALIEWLRELGIENKIGIIAVDEVAEIIKRINLNSYEGNFKIVLVWMAEQLNQQAASKLLKILEEPPEDTVFLLVSEDQTALLPTILSRVQLTKLQPLTESEIIHYISSIYDENDERIRKAATHAHGNLNKALLYMSESAVSDEELEGFMGWMRNCYKLSFSGLMSWTEQMSASGRENQKSFLLFALDLLRNAWLLGSGNEQLVAMPEADKEKLRKFSRFIHGGNVIPVLNLVDKSYHAIESNAAAKILFMNLSLKLHNLLLMPQNSETKIV